MNESIDLRNRIIRMRENINFDVTNSNSKITNLSSKSENGSKNNDFKLPKNEKTAYDDKTTETIKNTFKNKTKSESHSLNKNKIEYKNRESSLNNNEAQFLMLANKFNQAVEVILELSDKVEKLEKKTNFNSYKSERIKISLPFFNSKIFIFLLIIPIIVLGFFTLPFDFSLIKLIIIDVFSNI